MGINEDYDEFNRNKREFKTDIPERSKESVRQEEEREQQRQDRGSSRFELDAESREKYMEDHIYTIARKLGCDIQKGLIEGIVEKFEGEDAHALNILGLAVKQRKLEEYALKLDAFYESLKYTNPYARISLNRPLIRKFFQECYADLDPPSANL